MKISLFTYLFLIGTSLNAQTTIILTPQKDNSIYSSSGAVSNGQGIYLFTGNTGGGVTHRVLLKFNIAGSVPAGATITAVSLSVNVNKVPLGVAGNTLKIHKLTADWGEDASDAGGSESTGGPAAPNDATWTHQFFSTTMWSNAGGDFQATPSGTVSVAGTGLYTFNSTPSMVNDVQTWLNAPSGNFGWALLGDESQNKTSRRIDARESSTASNRPALSVTYTTTIPVELIGFQAIEKNKNIELTWQTASERDSKYFEIEAKPLQNGVNTEGGKFIKIGEQKAAGNAQTVQKYTFIHQAPPLGIYLYRLKQVDFDGKTMYSPIISVKLSDRKAIKIYPNPVSNHFVIETNATEIEQVELIDATGRLMRSILNIKNAVDISDLPKGIYFIKLKTEGQTVVEKLIKL